MKKFAKFFLAVAALFAIACTTDATEDLGVQFGGEGQMTLTLSLEESRTQLGEEADGIYPLYWSEGDKISVNGNASEEAVISSENASVATFTMPTSGTPYCIAYPAAPAGQVIFAAEQTHVAGKGTFASNVATMYGYSESGSGFTMHHLTGVLKFGIAGSAKLEKIQISTVNGPIAGTYDIDFKSGEVTPSAEAANVITYSFGEGLQLTEQAQDVYVVVPAGTYNCLNVTLFDTNNKVMVAEIMADKKPLKAGVVRTFSTPILYEPNTTDFYIEDYEDLAKFAEAVASQTEDAPFTQNALVVANIEVPAEAVWTPIDGFISTFNGNGHTINGLKAPLFGTTSALIKNVKLTNVAIEETERVKVGAIACELLGSMINCSASGSMTINNTTFAASSVANNYSDITIGGLVGTASGATVKNSTNNVNIVAKSLCAETLACKATIGGVVGCAANSSSFSYLVNNGSISFESKTQKHNMYISGVVGKASDLSGQTPFIEFNNCTNNGTLSTAVGSSNTGDILLTGITGTLNLNADNPCSNCTNNGDLIHRGTSKNFRASGLTSYNSSAPFSNCKNTGDITVEETAKVTSVTYLAGLSNDSISSPSISDCSNSGNITIKTGASLASDVYLSGLFKNFTNCNFTNNHNSGNLTIEDNLTMKKLVKLAGIADTVSGAETVASNCTNSGSFTVGAYTNNTTGNNGRLYMGGLFNNVTGGNFTNCKNLEGGKMTIKPKRISTEAMIAGIVSYTSAGVSTTFTDCENKADITLEPEYLNGLYLGGIMGQVYSKTTEYVLSFIRTKNSGNITVGGTSISYVETDATAEDGSTSTTIGAGQIVGIGGLIGYTLGTTNILTDCDNSGAITINPTGKCYDLCVGGIIGYHQHRLDNYITTFTDCDNTGKITYAPAYVHHFSRVGGFHGYAYGHTSYSKGQDIYSNCTSTAEVEISGNGTLKDRTFFGSFIGDISQMAKFDNCSSTNTSKVTIKIAKISGTTYLGWIGTCSSLESTATYEFTNCSNYSIVDINSNGLGALEMSGFAGTAYSKADAPKGFKITATDCKVGGSLTVNGKSGTLRFGGFNVYPYGGGNAHVLTRFVCDCDLNLHGDVNGNIQIGGIGAYISAAITTVDKCTISGDVNFTGSTTAYFSYGGYANQNNLGMTRNNTVNNFVHSGNITLTGSVGTNLLLGGFSTQQKTVYYANNVANTGNFTLGTADKALTIGGDYAYIAGLFAHLQALTNDENEDGVADPYVLTGDMINTGNITIQNTTIKKGEACKVKVGGIGANVTASDVINGAKCYCGINVSGINHASIGYISGSPRTSATVKDCYLAGYGLVYDSTDDEYIESPLFSATNYFDFIYGGSTAWTGDENYDGCKYLTTKPVVK